MKNTIVTNDEGIVFAVRVIEPGEWYGVDDCLTYPDPESSHQMEQAARGDTLIEFWDVEFSQFVSRYYASNLRTPFPRNGLVLQGGVSRWKVSADNVREALKLAEG